MHTRSALFSFAIFATSAGLALGQTNPFANKLGGDWGGERTKLAAQGITFELDWTQFLQGLFSGTGSKDFKYGGRLDTYLNFDTTKLGWWKGGFIRTHGEMFYGDLPRALGSPLWPTSLGSAVPLTGVGRFEFTSLHVLQFFDPKTFVMVGKLNTVDFLANDFFAGGQGDRRFMNVALAAPPNGLLPPTIFGLVYSKQTDPVGWTFMAYDPKDRTGEYLPKGLFHSGVNLSASAKVPVAMSGRTTNVTAMAIYSTADKLDLRDILLPPDFETRSRKGSLNGSLQFQHFLKENPQVPGDGYGLSVKVGFGDGNPNPIQFYVSGGIGGKGLIASRPQDGFGLGYFYYKFGKDLKQAVAPLLEFENESGFEAFYSYALAPWADLTADLQYINPAFGSADQAFIGGLRLRLRF
jgi:porin